MDKEDFFDEARRIVTAFANTSPIDESSCNCPYCDYHFYNPVHGPDCIWLAARKLIEN